MLAEPYYSRVLHLCQELQSGRWWQVEGTLRTDGPYYDDQGGWRENPRFCCLGVACELALGEGVGHRVDNAYWDDPGMVAFKPEGNKSDLTRAVMAWYGFDDANPEITILCSDISDHNDGDWCDDCRGNNGENRNTECTNTVNVAATTANDDIGCTFTQIADGFARRWLGGVEALDATPQS